VADLFNRYGIHWANVLISEHLANQALSFGAHNFVVIDGAYGAVEKIAKTVPGAIIVHRHCVSNWMEVEPEDYARQLADLFRQHQQYTEHIMLENEQDIYPNWPGEGQPIIDRLKFAAIWNVLVANMLTELCPTAIIHTPALAHERVDLPLWFEIWKPVLDACNVLDMHCYWEKGGQYYAPGLYDPVESYHRAFRYRKIRDFLKTKNYWIPIFISECGNFAPAMPDYADQLIYYFRGIEEDANDVIGATPFILKSDKWNAENDIAAFQPNLPEFFLKLKEANKVESEYPRRKVMRTDTPQSTDVRVETDLRDLRATIERHPVKMYSRRSISSIDTIVIHHVGVDGKCTPEAIARFHSRNRNWPGPAYQFYIRQDGTIYWLNSLEVVSAHTLGHNEHTLGICFEGSFIEGRLPTEQQYDSGQRLVAVINKSVGGRLPLKGHKQVPGHETNQCPGDFDLSRLTSSESLELQLAKGALREIQQITNETLSELGG